MQSLKQVSTFLKKDTRGKARKIVREVYLHDDIHCGVRECKACPTCKIKKGSDGQKYPLKLSAKPTASPIFQRVLIFDADAAAAQVDLIQDDPCIDNCVLLTSVISDIRKTNFLAALRLRSLCYNTHVQGFNDPWNNSKILNVDTNADGNNTRRHFYVYANDFSAYTYVTRLEGETFKEKSRRALYTAVTWWKSHLSPLLKPQQQSNVLLLVNTKAAKADAIGAGINDCLTVTEYVELMQPHFPNCGEKLVEVNEELEEQHVRDVTDTTAGESRSYYTPYLNESEINKRIRTQTLYQGIIRMSRGTCLEAYVSYQEELSDIKISGRQHINRAVNGDVVAVEIIEDTNTVGGLADEAFPSAEVEECEITNVGDMVTSNDVRMADVCGEDTIKRDIELNKGVGDEIRKRGRVVGIIKKNWREYAGTLRPLKSNESFLTGRSSHVKAERMFIPANPCIPFIRIKTRHSNELEGKRLVVVIDSWSRFSLRPVGHWIRILGVAGDTATENDLILRERGVITRDFPLSVIKCLPPADWTFTDLEIKDRLDMRQLNNVVVCSIDPPGCKDIDDALSVEELSNGNYKVGVHIADVTHFVKPDTAIDREAAERCTTVYLVDRRTDMFPGLLTTDLCSLVGNRDRLAFSVFWEMTKDAQILKSEFKKTVIRSQAALTYSEAQLVIDDPNNISQLALSLRSLHSLSQGIRKKRMANGALQLASAEVTFELDTETHDPTDVSLYEYRDTNKLVEDFMCLANTTVAEFILSKYPTTSVLRRHPPPKMDELKRLQSLLASRGINDFSFSDSSELGRSLDNANYEGDQNFNKLLRILTTRCMNQAVYFCTGDVNENEYRHYGLATDRYTHFTSPIRRYADVLVHRLLSAALGFEPLPDQLIQKQRVSQQCSKMNEKHRNAGMAARDSIEYGSFRYFKGSGSQTACGVILAVRKNGILVQIPRYGIESVIRLDASQIVEFDSDRNALRVTCEQSQNESPPGQDVLSVFDKVTVRICADEQFYRNQTKVTFLSKSAKAVSLV